MNKITRNIRDIKRISHVINILFRNGLGFVVENLDLKYHLPFPKRLLRHKYKKPVEPQVRLRKALEELGGTYVKFGQLLSIRPDKIPMEYCKELSRLQDKVKEFPYEEVKIIVEHELKNPIKKIFKTFGKKPIASASIGQVHKAVLKNGKTVAVKIQRPGIKNMLEADIDILYYFANEMQKRKMFRKYSPIELIKEFERYTKEELNYLLEAKNIEDFYQNSKGNKNLVVPRVFWDHTTDKLITMEFIKGIKISEIDDKGKNIKSEKLIQIGLKELIKQFYIDGLFHADPHPGNLLIISKDKIAMLDFGIVGRLSEKMKYQSLKFAAAMLDKDVDKVYDILLEIGNKSEDTDLEDFKKEIAYLIYKWYSSAEKHTRVTHLMHKLFDSCVNHGIHLPKDLVLVAKASITLEGTYRTLDPDFDFIEEAKPHLMKILNEDLIAKEIFRRVLEQKTRVGELFEELPEKASKILNTLGDGKLKVDIDDTDIKTLGWDIDRSSNRLSYGLMISAFIVAAGLIMIPNPAPQIIGVSYFSWVCFIAAMILGTFLASSIKNEGKYDKLKKLDVLNTGGKR